MQHELDDIDGVLVSAYVAAGLVTFEILESPSLLGFDWSFSSLLIGGNGWGVSIGLAVSSAILAAIFLTNRYDYSGKKDWWGMNQVELISFFGTVAIFVGIAFFAPVNDMIGSNLWVSYGGYFLSYMGLYGAGWAA